MLRICAALALSLLASTRAPLSAAEWKADPPAKAEAWKPPEGGGIPLGKTVARAAFAEHFGPFALVNDRAAGAERVVYDLRTGKEYARLPNKIESSISIPDLPSPDGAFAVRSAKLLGKELELTATADGTIRTIELPAATTGYAWLDSKRLLVALLAGRGEVAVVDAATGTVGRRIALPSTPALDPIHRNFATSPGGRYAAIPADQGIVFFDSTDSTAALMMPTKSKKPSVAFSADGTRLAMLDEGDTGEGRLTIWTAGDKEPRSTAVARKNNAPNGGRAIQAVRAGGWLVDDENVLNEAGELVRTIPNEIPNVAYRLALDAETVLSVGSPNPGAPTELRTIRTSGALVKTLLVGQYRDASKKTVNPEPFLGSFEAVVPAPVLPTTTAHPTSRPFVALHVARTGTWAVVERDFSGSSTTVQMRGVSIWTADGLGAPVDLPPARRVFGELAADEGFLTADSPAAIPATLAFHNPAGDMVCRWRLADNAARESALRYAAVIDRHRVVTLNEKGLLVGWKMPQCEAVWTLDLPGAWQATLSPKGDRLVVATPKGLHIVDAHFGNHWGLLKADLGGDSREGAICVRADGTQIVVGHLVGFGYRYFVWNLAGNRTFREFDLPLGTSGRSLVHLGGDYVFNGRSALEVQRGVSVWESVDFPADSTASQPGDGRLWHLAGDRPGLARRTVQAIAFPRAGLADLLKTMDESKDKVLQPGDRIRIELDCPGAPDRYRALALAKITERLRSDKMTVADDAPITLRTTVRMIPTGDELNLTWRDIEKLGRQEVLKPYSLRCSTEVLRGGKTVQTGSGAEFKMQTGLPGREIVITDDSKTAKEFFERQVWNQAVLWVGFSVPGATAITPTGSPITLPLRGRVNKGALETDWPKGYSPPAEPSSGNPPADTEAPDPEVAPAAPASTPAWVWIAGCGGVGVLGVLAASVGLLIWLARGKKAKKPAIKRRRNRDDDDD